MTTSCSSFSFAGAYELLLNGGNIFGEYKKNYNPVMATVLSVLIVFIFCSIIGYIAWTFYLRVIRFRMLCKQYQINAENMSFLNSFIQKFRIPFPFFLLEKQQLFDDFSNSIAETYHRESPLEEMQADALQLYSIRKLLKFRHGFNNVSYVHSSRALIKDHPVRILYFDEVKKCFVAFESKVMERNEFFLAIEAPRLELSMLILGQAQPFLEVWFQKNQKEYRFDTRCWFAPPPHNIWYLEHSKKLNKIDLIEDLHLSGSILYSPSELAEDIEEYPVKIKSLEYTQVKFCINIPDISLQKEGYIVLSIRLKDTEVACQGVIVRIEEEHGQKYYTVPFKDLSAAHLQLLLAFMRNPTQYL